MKRAFLLILTLSFWSVSGAQSQSSNTNTNPTPGFGSGYSGSTSTSTTPSVTPPSQSGTSTDTGTGTFSVPRNDTPVDQRMEAGPSSTVAGGAMGGAMPSQTYPSNGQTTVPSTQPNLPSSPVQGTGTNTNTNTGTGVGTGTVGP